MSPSSLSSQFLGLRVSPPPRSATAPSLSPPSPSSFRSAGISATYAAASERSHPAYASPSSFRSAGISAAYAAESERSQAAPAPSPVAFPSPSSSPSSLYDVLGVSPSANSPEIKAAYRRLALECHPDVVATGRRGASADGFMRVHAAYATLSDPGKRADYDMELTAAAALLIHNRRQQASSPRVYTRCPSYPGCGRRTWETDQCW